MGCTMAKGDRVMIIDAGGGTIDINVSEIVEYDDHKQAVSLSEATLPGGGPFGGIATGIEVSFL